MKWFPFALATELVLMGGCRKEPGPPVPCGKNSCAAITARRDVIHWVGGLGSYLQERPSSRNRGGAP